MEYHLRFCAQVATVPIEDSDHLDEHLEAVMDELGDLEDGVLFDADMSATLSTGDVEITIGVRTDDPVEATRRALAAIRSAVHAAGGFTPGWPGDDKDDGDWELRYLGHSQQLGELTPA